MYTVSDVLPIPGHIATVRSSEIIKMKKKTNFENNNDRKIKIPHGKINNKKNGRRIEFHCCGFCKY